MTEPRPILIATRNAHKTREIREILGERFSVFDLSAHPRIPEAIESGSTFEENAALKALNASGYFDGLVLADDSGLEVDALGGAPGVRSARYAGEGADDEANRALLLKELLRIGTRGRHRSARFRCVLALARGARILKTFDGVVEGVIANRPKGAGGFGYDSLFIPDGHCRTFGELPPEVKNRESHRARALAKAGAWLLAACQDPGTGGS